MSYRLACDLSDRIAGIAPNAAADMMTVCSPTRPVPVMHMHSILDTNVPMAGGEGNGPGTPGVSFTPLNNTMRRWAIINGCGLQPTVSVLSGYNHSVWSGCQPGGALELYVTADGGHAWPGGLPGSSNGDTPSTAISANDLLLSFFQRG
jgi:hypothetical protein